MKKTIVLLLILTSLSLAAVSESFLFKSNDIMLELENIHLKKVVFQKGDEIMVEYPDKAVLEFEQTDQVFSVRALTQTKISLYLPDSKKYLYEDKNGTCSFNNKILNFESDDEFIIISEEGIQVINQQEDLLVEINNERIFVKEDGETIIINDKGVQIDGPDPMKLSGPFGLLLGAFVKGVTNFALNSVGRTPDKVFVNVVNDDIEDFNNLSFGSR